MFPLRISCLFYISLLPSFVVASFCSRRPRARCRPHRNNSVKSIRLRSPFLSPPLLASRVAYLYLIPLALLWPSRQSGNHRPLFCSRVFAPSVLRRHDLPRAFSLTQDRGLGPQTIPELIRAWTNNHVGSTTACPTRSGVTSSCPNREVRCKGVDLALRLRGFTSSECSMGKTFTTSYKPRKAA